MTTCFKGWERSKHNYRDYEGAEMDSYASTDSDAFSMKKPTLIISPDGSKKWVILEFDPDKNSHRSLQEVEGYFQPRVDKIRGDKRGLKAASLSYTAIPDSSKMEKSWLKTQLILGGSVTIFGKSVGKMIFYTAVGGAAGLGIGIVIGGTVGGIVSGGPGVVPGAMVGGLIGTGVGGAAGAGYGISQVIGDGIDDVKEFYRDFQILEDVENGSHKSVKSTISVAQDFFSHYLEEFHKKPMTRNIFSISGDIMLFPVKTNCNHVFELLSITNSLKESERCPLCRKNVKKLEFDFETMATIRDVVREVLVELKKSAGNQNLLLLQKQFKITKFSHLDEITRAKIKNKTPLSLAEKRTLYHIFSEYSKTFASINSYMEKSLRMILEETHYKKKIDDVQFGELTKQLQEHFK